MIALGRYADDQTAFLIKVAAIREGSAQPDAKHLSGLMRTVFEQPEIATLKGASARAAAVGRFSPTVVGQQMESLVDRVHRKVNDCA